MNALGFSKQSAPLTLALLLPAGWLTFLATAARAIAL